MSDPINRNGISKTCIMVDIIDHSRLNHVPIRRRDLSDKMPLPLQPNHRLHCTTGKAGSIKVIQLSDMEDMQKSTTWDGREFSEQTSDPSISMVAEDVPTLTVAAILGVTVVVLIAIAAVFLLGVLIDCRQQRLLANKLGEVRRTKNHKRGSAHPEVDVVSIAHHMEEPELTVTPAHFLRQIP